MTLLLTQFKVDEGLRKRVDVAAEAAGLTRTAFIVSALEEALSPVVKTEPLVKTSGAKAPTQTMDGRNRSAMRPCEPIGGMPREEAFAVMAHHPSQRDPKGWREGKYR